MNSQLNLTGSAKSFVDTFFFEPPIISFHVLTVVIGWLTGWRLEVAAAKVCVRFCYV